MTESERITAALITATLRLTAEADAITAEADAISAQENANVRVMRVLYLDLDGTVRSGCY
jgi:hypothetical protein